MLVLENLAIQCLQSRSPWLADKENFRNFRCSKKAKITLKPISFWRNISFSIFKFCPLLHIIKADDKILSIFAVFTNAFVTKEKRRSYAQRLMKIKKLEKGGLCFFTGCFIKPFKMIINHFYSFLLYIYNTQSKLIKR